MSEPLISPDANERIGAYLASTPFGLRRPRVVPLTGDASDRRYFRVFLEGDDSIVLALHTGPIAFDTMPFSIGISSGNPSLSSIPLMRGVAKIRMRSSSSETKNCDEPGSP